LTFRIRGTPVTLTDRTLACKSDPAPVLGRLTSIEILVDRTSVEVFANGGEVSLSACFLPTDERREVMAAGGPVKLLSLRVNELRSMWEAKKE